MTFSEAEIAQVRELLDRQAIWNCLMKYTRGVDRVDERLIRGAFWEDAHDAHGGVHGSPQDFLDWFLPNQLEREVAQHLVTNHDLSFVEPGLARSETYFVSVAKKYDSDQIEQVGGRYQDEWEFREGEWRLAARLVLLDWQCVSDASGMRERLSRSHIGSRDLNDPSYARRVERRTGVTPR